MSIAEKIIRAKTDLDEAYAAGYEKGKAEGGPNPLEYAVDISYLFQSIAFPTDYELNLTVPNVTTLEFLFQRATGIKSITVDVPNTGGVDARNAFNGCSATEITFPHGISFSAIGTCFYGASRLTAINGVIDCGPLTNVTELKSAFSSCSNLVEVRFAKDSIHGSISFPTSSKLSDESIASIIDGLAPVTETATLTLPASVVSKLTEEQVNTILNKGWTV